MTRTSRWATVLVALASLLVVVPASPASADFGCPGDRDSWRQFRNSAGTVAAVLQRYDTADGICINLVSKNEYFGVSKYMRIRVCDGVNDDFVRYNCVTDAGDFDKYAGPVYKTDNCVTVRSTMYDPFNGDVIMDHWDWIGACN